jgi:hypothetical protein
MLELTMGKFYHFTTQRGLDGIYNDGQPYYNKDIYPDYTDLTEITNLEAKQIDALKREWEETKYPFIDGQHIRGIWPRRRFIPIGNEGPIRDPLVTRFIFEGVYDPIPKGWIDEKDNLLADLFFDLRRSNNTKIILLEVETVPQDLAYVVDFSVLKPVGNERVRDGSIRYWNSRIHIDQYTGDEGYKWPSVVCWSPIPLKRINIALEMDIPKGIPCDKLVDLYVAAIKDLQGEKTQPNADSWATSLGPRLNRGIGG